MIDVRDIDRSQGWGSLIDMSDIDRNACYRSSMPRLRLVMVCCYAAWAIASLVWGSNVGVTVVGLLFATYGAIALIVVSLVMVIIASIRKQRLHRPWLEPFGAVAVLVLIYLDVPFYARFFASKPLLDRYVREVAAAGRAGELPRQVGLFTVSETEVLSNHAVRIITTSCMFDECGLVFATNGPPPVIGEDSYKAITSEWWQWWRSW